jgi:hypothetical protein
MSDDPHIQQLQDWSQVNEPDESTTCDELSSIESIVIPMSSTTPQPCEELTDQKLTELNQLLESQKIEMDHMRKVHQEMILGLLEPEPCEQELADLEQDAGRPLTGHEATLFRIRKLHGAMVRAMLEGKP